MQTSFEWGDLTFTFELSGDSQHIGIDIRTDDGATEVGIHLNPDLDKAAELASCITDVIAAAGGGETE